MDAEVKRIIVDIAKEYNKRAKPDIKKEDFERYPHLFFLGCLMNVQYDSDKAFEIPKKIAKDLGSYEFSAFLGKDKEYYDDIFQRKKLHRFYTNKSVVFYEAIRKICDKYDCDVTNIWKGTPSSAELIIRLKDFKGVGIKVATMIVNLLHRDYGVDIADTHCIDASPDVHVKRVMWRLGLVNPPKNKQASWVDSESVALAARMLSPSYPALIDYCFWKLGKDKICENKCNANECPLSKVCPKIDALIL